MPSIFISYRRDPQAAWAGRLHDRLVAQFGTGSVFLDVDMEPGVDFVDVIEERVSQCDALIALIGKDWRPERLARAEDWVRLEIEAALKRRVRVIPVLVDGVRMPAAEELPESLRPLVRRHALDVGHGSFHRDTEVLIRAIQGLQQATKAAAVAAVSRDPFVHEADGLGYVWIPPGRFMMGASPGDTECRTNEKPAHEVEITRGFWLSETPVTQAAWRKVMGSSPSHFKGDDLPVEQVSWEEAAEYCRKINGRLPTEAEWEYAARAGTTGARYGELDEIAWFGDNSGRKRLESAKLWDADSSKYWGRLQENGNATKPMRGKQPNAFGLYDTLGNVWEWVADWYGPYEAGSVRDPKGPGSGKYRGARGGGWDVVPLVVRASVRIDLEPSGRNIYFGFRSAGEFR